TLLPCAGTSRLCADSNRTRRPKRSKRPPDNTYEKSAALRRRRLARMMRLSARLRASPRQQRICLPSFRPASSRRTPCRRCAGSLPAHLGHRSRAERDGRVGAAVESEESVLALDDLAEHARVLDVIPEPAFAHLRVHERGRLARTRELNLPSEQ